MKKIKPHGCIEKPNTDGKIILPIGHYAIVNCRNKPNNIYTKISIYGLGSCIALILFDSKNKVSGMSHILLPKCQLNKKIEYPHKYADLSANLLLQELLNRGAIKKNIKAVIVGGSKIFELDENGIGINNIKAIKNELKKLEIKIIGENTGGSEGRVVIFDTKDFSVYVRLTRESNLQKIKYS